MKLAISGKGGVGKSTLAGLLAQAYAERGRSVLAVDADPAPCLARALGFPDTGGAAAFTRSLASEVGRSGVTANCVSLGTIWRSPSPPDEQALARVRRDYPVGRYGTREDVAGMVAFLASDAASWITGQVYGVNGGYAYGL